MTPLDHTALCHPQESCGFFVGSLYIPCRNVAEDPLHNFRIPPDEWRADATALVHSHPDGSPWLSRADRYHQHRSGMDWVLVAGGKLHHYRYAPLLRGRIFAYGVRDCYTLVRDACMLAGIGLPDVSRGDIDADARRDLFLRHAGAFGFYRVDTPRRGDVLLSSIAGHANHAGIYLGGGRVLHHPADQLSRIEDLGGIWHRDLHSVWRHRDWTPERFTAIDNDIQEICP